MEFKIQDDALYIDNHKVVFENHIILKKLGNGANAFVFLTLNKTLNRMEALKIWIPRKGYQTVDITRYLKEIKKNARFNDDRIAQIYSANIIDKYYYAFMEYCPGITLKEYLSIGQSYCKRLYILNKILSTMYKVYENGVYHGDLHSKNIIVNNEDDKIKILDFGTSVFVRDKTKSHKRDAHMLFDLAIQILPELNDFTFFDDSVREKPSIDICICIIHLIDLLCLELRDGGDFPFDGYIISLVSIAKQCSALDTKAIEAYAGTIFSEFYQYCKPDNINIINIVRKNDIFLEEIMSDLAYANIKRDSVKMI